MKEELEMFVERAARLESSKYWAWLHSRRGANMEKIISGDWLAHKGLDIDALDAYCMNLRLLIQDRDGFSIRHMRKFSREWSSAAEEYKLGVENAVEKLEEELCSKSLVRIYEDRETTNKDVFDVIFYGGVVHCNPDKRREFKRITESGIFSYFVFQAFVNSLFIYRNCIMSVAYNVYHYMNSEAGKKDMEG